MVVKIAVISDVVSFSRLLLTLSINGRLKLSFHGEHSIMLCFCSVQGGVFCMVCELVMKEVTSLLDDNTTKVCLMRLQINEEVFPWGHCFT